MRFALQIRAGRVGRRGVLGSTGGLSGLMCLGVALLLAAPVAVRAQKALPPLTDRGVVAAAAAAPAAGGPFSRFDLPDEWEARFWAEPGVTALLGLEPKALMELVPVQSGLRYCRCPGCDAPENDEPLVWSVAKPQVLSCRRCGLTLPNDDIPAKNDQKKVPEEAVEVLPRVIHHYPYHLVPPQQQRYPEERLYLAARRDYEARAFLAKAALYAAVRYHEQPAEHRNPALARMAAILLLRFAQVYPAYATHYDQPGEPKYLQQADLPPPYRRGYRTGKWDSTANLDVPINLLIACALLRADPALKEAGLVLGDPNPAATIERDLFRASAEFVRLQTDEFGEMSLHAYRGLLAVGRLLNDPALVHEAFVRLGAFAERGFYHDGLWRQGNAAAHRRVVSLIDGWIDPLLPASGASADSVVPAAAGVEVPMLALARAAGSVILTDPRVSAVLPVSWPSAGSEAIPRHAGLLGGAGLARLALGGRKEALDLELRALDGHGVPQFQRQAIRLSVAGQPVLGDLDDLPPTQNGWDRATASHNTVVVDGLNQREAIARSRTPAPAGRFLFFAADPDFQVVVLDDPHAYPQSTTRYRQTAILASTNAARFGVCVFDVHGGLQHDQIFHAAAGGAERWELADPLEASPATLLPPSIAFLPGARAEDGRWFVQAYGEFSLLGQAIISRPTTATLTRADGPGVRLHVLGDLPLTAYRALSSDPSAGTESQSGRGGLILRRRSETGATLKTTFVTLFEPLGSAARPLARVGRVSGPPEAVVLYLETATGPEHLVVNLAPGKPQEVKLADGQRLRTDGLVVRVTPDDLMLAGGSFVEVGQRQTRLSPVSGSVVAVNRGGTAAGRGWFQTDAPVPEPDALVGRTLLIQHGDGTTRGWTLSRVDNSPAGDRARLHVHEEPGFLIDPSTGLARYYQFPRDTVAGPHHFSVSRIAHARSPAARTQENLAP